MSRSASGPLANFAKLPELLAERDEMTDQQNVDVDRPARHEELRFAKKQQWFIATSAVTLLAAIFAIARSTTLSDVEKALATVLVVFIAGFGMAFLFNLQDHMMEVRKELDPRDTGPWVRGSEVLFVLVGIIVLSAGLVVYFLRFPHALSCR
jgi:hypothetical protein